MRLTRTDEERPNVIVNMHRKGKAGAAVAVAESTRGARRTKTSPLAKDAPGSTGPAKGERKSARERLLAAAEELFYEEGVITVGIDRIIERAGVEKASLYDTFGSKEELTRAYLAARHEARQARMTEGLAKLTTPRERLICSPENAGFSYRSDRAALLYCRHWF